MKNLVIVALPAEDDYVNQISSEKVAHMTLLFLGDATRVQNLSKIIDFVEHAANTSLSRFGLDVDRRGVLGTDQADVLFFSRTKWSGYEEVRDFRSYLLQDSNIRKAYDSTEQFDDWVPHLTLGYPTSPANPDERDYPGISYVSFDRIAVWTDDFSGIEFTLERNMDFDMAMGGIGKMLVEETLSHHGVKGMKWGVRRKATVDAREVVVSDTRKKLKTSGGKGLPAHPDAIKARTIGQKGKGSGLKALSDKELQDYAKRLQLEQNVKRLNFNDQSPPKKAVLTILGQSGKQTVQNAANDVGAQAVKKSLKLALAAA